MKLQNKILLILIIAFSFIILWNSEIFASTSFGSISKDKSFKGKTLYLPDFPSDVDVKNDLYIITKYNDNILLFVVPSNCKNYYCIAGSSSSACDFYLHSSLDVNSSTVSFRFYSIDNGFSLVFQEDGLSSYEWKSCGSAQRTKGNEVEILYSNVNLYKNDCSLFFQAPVVEEKPAGVIAPLLEAEEMEKANLQIRVIIPLILVVVVSFLGLRKALKMLSQILHRS